MAVFGKFAYAAGVSSEALLLVRFALAAAVLVVLLLLRPRLRRESSQLPRTGSQRLPVGLLVTALGLGAIGYAAQASLYFEALTVMDASLLSLVLYIYPLLVAVAAAALGRDRMTRQRCLALAAASGGALLVLGGAASGTIVPLGVGLALGSAITYTVYILVADRVVQRLPPVLLSALVMSGAALPLGARALLTGGVDLGFGPAGWLWLVCIAVVSTVLAMLSFFAGLQRTGPATAAILSTFEPVVTTALAALTLGEFLTPTQLAGGMLVLSAVVLLHVRSTRRPTPATPRTTGSPAAPPSVCTTTV